MLMRGALEFLCFGEAENLIRPCVDCGLVTGRFCDGPRGETGPQCYAAYRVPTESWEPKQRTPFCLRCEELQQQRHGTWGMCHFCRGVNWCTPPPRERSCASLDQQACTSHHMERRLHQQCPVTVCPLAAFLGEVGLIMLFHVTTVIARLDAKMQHWPASACLRTAAIAVPLYGPKY